MWFGSFLDSRRLFAIFVIQFDLWLYLEILMSYYLLLVELPKPSFHPFIHEQAVILTWMTGKIVFMCLFSSLPRQERYLQKEGKEQKLVTARQISCNAWLGYLLFPLTKPKPLQDWKLSSKMPQLRNKSRAKKAKLSSIFVVESWCSRQGVLYLDVFECGRMILNCGKCFATEHTKQNLLPSIPSPAS